MHIFKMRKTINPVGGSKKSVKPSLNIIIPLLPIMPRVPRPREAQVSKVTHIQGISKTAGNVIIHRASPHFLIRFKNNVEITKNQPIRVIIGFRKMINQFASKEFIRVVRIPINARGTPHHIMRIDKKINIVEIMHLNINVKITIIP
jgi:hypothetical protein